MSFNASRRFQFRFGAIDSAGEKIDAVAVLLFQFRFGAIDSNIDVSPLITIILFQFRFGAIDRVR